MRKSNVTKRSVLEKTVGELETQLMTARLKLRPLIIADEMAARKIYVGKHYIEKKSDNGFVTVLVVTGIDETAELEGLKIMYQPKGRGLNISTHKYFNLNRTDVWTKITERVFIKHLTEVQRRISSRIRHSTWKS